jgi:methyl-accepting chemotaxis protein
MSSAALAVAEPKLDNRQLLAALRAFRRGDFSVRLPGDLTGPDGEIAEAFNDVVELNDRMTAEFERLGEVVGKQGRIGQRARLPTATGSWATSVNTVNDLITDMMHPTAEMARVIGAVAKGDLSQTMDLENQERPLRGEFLRTGKVVNTMVGQLNAFSSEVTRVAKEVGTEGKLGGRRR